MALGMGNCVQAWFGENRIKVICVWTDLDVYFRGGNRGKEFRARIVGLENSLEEAVVQDKQRSCI